MRVPCASTTVGSPGFASGDALRSPSTRSKPRATRPLRYACLRSTPVSRSAMVTPAPLKPGRVISASWSVTRLKVSARDGLGGRGRRVDRTHGIDAGDVVRPLELGQGPCRDESGEAVERPREDLVTLDAHLPLAQASEEELLCSFCLDGPRLLLLRGRLILGRGHAVGERGRGEDDEDALPRLGGAARGGRRRRRATRARPFAPTCLPRPRPCRRARARSPGARAPRAWRA